MESNLAAAASTHRLSVDDLHAHRQGRAAPMLELPGAETIRRRPADAVG